MFESEKKKLLKALNEKDQVIIEKDQIFAEPLKKLDESK